MASVTFTMKRGKNVFGRTREFYAYIVDILRNTVGKHIKDEYRKVWADWTHKPIATASVNKQGDKLILLVDPGGKKENVKIYSYVTLGTKPHPITAKNAPYLTFRGGYSARTQPVGRYGVGTGRATGLWAKKVMVKHPGIKARKFEETIAGQQAQWFMDTIKKAFNDFYQ